MILYEDAQLVVCCKPRGVLSAADSSGQESMASLLAPRAVFPVHRLDRDVPGVMVFAKTREAAAFLSAHLTAGKEYLALAEGAPCKEPEELYDLLFHDRARNKTYVVRRTRAGVREARLICTPLRLLPDGRAALHLQLLTGRTHQIRAHLAYLGKPVLGDIKYGNRKMNERTGAKTQALCAVRISFLDIPEENTLHYLSGKVIKLKDPQIVKQFDALDKAKPEAPSTERSH